MCLDPVRFKGSQRSSEIMRKLLNNSNLHSPWVHSAKIHEKYMKTINTADGTQWTLTESICYYYEHCCYCYHRHCYSWLALPIKQCRGPTPCLFLLHWRPPPFSAMNSRRSPSRPTPLVKLFLPWCIHVDLLSYLFTKTTYYLKTQVLGLFCSLSSLYHFHAEWHWPVYLASLRFTLLIHKMGP